MERGGARQRVQKMTAPWCFCIIQPHRHVVYILYTKLIMRLLLVWGWEDYIRSSAENREERVGLESQVLDEFHNFHMLFHLFEEGLKRRRSAERCLVQPPQVLQLLHKLVSTLDCWTIWDMHFFSSFVLICFHCSFQFDLLLVPLMLSR